MTIKDLRSHLLSHGFTMLPKFSSGSIGYIHADGITKVLTTQMFIFATRFFKEKNIIEDSCSHVNHCYVDDNGSLHIGTMTI